MWSRKVKLKWTVTKTVMHLKQVKRNWPQKKMKSEKKKNVKLSR